MCQLLIRHTENNIYHYMKLFLQLSRRPCLLQGGGRIKYWIIVTISLVYFLSEFQSYFLDLLIQFRLSDPISFGIVYTLFFSATRPIGGLLFGIAFWSIARRIRGHAVKDYMTLSAYGVILVFSSIQITSLILAHYPPFGLASLSFLGLGSYLILVGIYSSAISVANDNNLRRSMRQTMERESVMLDNIATSQLETEIQNRITDIANIFLPKQSISLKKLVSNHLCKKMKLKNI